MATLFEKLLVKYLRPRDILFNGNNLNSLIEREKNNALLEIAEALMRDPMTPVEYRNITAPAVNQSIVHLRNQWQEIQRILYQGTLVQELDVNMLELYLETYDIFNAHTRHLNFVNINVVYEAEMELLARIFFPRPVQEPLLEVDGILNAPIGVSMSAVGVNGLSSLRPIEELTIKLLRRRSILFNKKDSLGLITEHVEAAVSEMVNVMNGHPLFHGRVTRDIITREIQQLKQTFSYFERSMRIPHRDWRNMSLGTLEKYVRLFGTLKDNVRHRGFQSVNMVSEVEEVITDRDINIHGLFPNGINFLPAPNPIIQDLDPQDANP